MSEDAHESGGQMEHQPFEWTCPTCKKLVVTWTQRALRDTIEQHEYKHRREIEEFRKTEAEKPKPEVGTEMVVYKEKNYDKLELTAADRGFLKTRHIKIDEEDKNEATN